MNAFIPRLVFREVRTRAGEIAPEARPIPLRQWLAMRRLLRRACDAPAAAADALVPPMDTFRGAGRSLRDPELSRLLADDELGTWALDVTSIEALWDRLRAERPAAVVEFGAGVSTVLLARYAQWRRAEGGDVVIVSIEQDAGVRDRVGRRLADSSLAEGVHVLHAPLSESSHYRLDLEQVARCLRGRPIDWVLVDGPAGPGGCRISTLPDVLPLCRDGARWFLDDALRDGELGILRDWSRRSGLTVEGIYPIGKGLATGVVRRGEPAAATAAA
jgi:hypothetical protein